MKLPAVTNLLPSAALALGLLLSACSPVTLLNETVGTSGVAIARDIQYEQGPRHGLDIYRADASVGARPVVVFFYGGSWEYGSKDDYVFVATALARRGLLVAVADYRLYPDVTYPAFLQDAAQAVAYMRRAAPSWGGDPNRVFVVGHSAGAYIAAMLALDPQYLAAAGDSRANLAGAVGISGPYDFLPITGPDIKKVFAEHVGDPMTQPINHVDGRNPPMLLLQGDADTTVYPRNAAALDQAILAAGGAVGIKMYPGVGHIGAVLGFSELFRDRSSVLDDVANFVNLTPPAVPPPVVPPPAAPAPPSPPS